MGAKKRITTAWTIEMGIFKPYLVEENPALFDKCFEKDWTDMKSIRFKHSTEDEMKEEMKKVYNILRE